MNNQRRDYGGISRGANGRWGDRPHGSGRRLPRRPQWRRRGLPQHRGVAPINPLQSFPSARFRSFEHDEAPDRIDPESPHSEPPVRYVGWRLYFDEGCSESHQAIELIGVFEAYFKKQFDADPLIQEEFAKQETWVSFPVDIGQMLTVNDIRDEIPDFLDKLTNIIPDIVIKAMGIAMYQIVNAKQKEMDVELAEEDDNEQPDAYENCAWLESSKPVAIHARLYNLKPLTQLKDIRAKHLRKLVSIRGTVVRMSSVQPMCVRLTFRCVTCFTSQVIPLPDGKYSTPMRCLDRECMSRSFIPDRTSKMVETVNQQTIKLQELSDDREEARVPRSIECELSSDLVQSCAPGDIVTLVGILKRNSSNGSVEDRRCRDDNCTLFSKYVAVNSLINESQASDSNEVESLSRAAALPVGVQFSNRDLMFVRELFQEPERFRLLVNSLCPSIYGHEAVKAGLLLALFGGTRGHGASCNGVPIRADAHVLVVGDPGLGKSQMLRACSMLSPRGVYVCGRNATIAGLTVSVSNREGGSGCESLEAGALVLSDGGCCCIDELDKMGARQQQALLESMEQQNVTVAKSGVLCNLKSRCSVLAAANPIAGHYDRAKTVAENLRGAFGSTSALLSRFDLVFILVDRPDKEGDAKLSEQIFKRLKFGEFECTSCSPSSLISSSAPGLHSSMTSSTGTGNIFPNAALISERLKVKDGESPIDVVPHCLLRKYIAYARTYVHPKLSREASDVLRSFYTQLRKSGRSETGTPVTLRQLESLIRLSEARARLDLRVEVTESDANDVIDIMRYSIIDTQYDEFGKVHFDRSQHGSGTSRQSKAKRFVAALNLESQRTHRTIFSVQEMRDIAKEMGVQVVDFDAFLESLNHQGYLLHKGFKHYELHCV